MLIEGYTVEECAALEPKVMAAYLEALHSEGVKDYDETALKRDWALATLHFPFYVALWFGSMPSEELTDPDFRNDLCRAPSRRSSATAPLRCCSRSCDGSTRGGTASGQGIHRR